MRPSILYNTYILAVFSRLTRRFISGQLKQQHGWLVAKRTCFTKKTVIESPCILLLSSKTGNACNIICFCYSGLSLFFTINVCKHKTITTLPFAQVHDRSVKNNKLCAVRAKAHFCGHHEPQPEGWGNSQMFGYNQPVVRSQAIQS